MTVYKGKIGFKGTSRAKAKKVMEEQEKRGERPVTEDKKDNSCQ